MAPQSCFGFCTPNHVRLIRSVYPSGPGEEGPRASNLSLLENYATARPQKLVKIGRYLEKTLKRDLRKERTGYIKVTFEIIAHLLKQCSPHVNLFADSVLRMVTDVLDSADLNLLMLASTTFVMFSINHVNGVAVDAEVARLYSTLISRFAKYACNDTQVQIKRMKSRLAGLRALHSVLQSHALFNSPEAEKLLAQIVPALLLNIIDKPRTSIHAPAFPAAFDGQVAETLARYGSSVHPGTTIQDDLITENELEHIAEQCFQVLAARCSAVHMPLMLNPMFAFMDENKKWGSTSFIIHCLAIVNHFTAPTNRSIVLSRALNRLALTDSDTCTESLKMQEALIASLAHLLSHAGKATLGLSVLELLDSLVKRLSASQSAEHQSHSNDQNNSTSYQQRTSLQEGLVSCIASLSRHIFYPNQLNEMIQFIISRLKLEELPTDNKDKLGHAGYRQSLLKCIVKLIEARLETVTATLERRRSVLSSPSTPSMPAADLSSSSAPASVPSATTPTGINAGMKPSSISLPMVETKPSAASLSSTGHADINSPHVNFSTPSLMLSSMTAGEVQRIPVPLENVAPLLHLVFSSDADVRHLTLVFIWKLLVLETVEPNVSLMYSDGLTPSTVGVSAGYIPTQGHAIAAQASLNRKTVPHTFVSQASSGSNGDSTVDGVDNVDGKTVNGARTVANASPAGRVDYITPEFLHRLHKTLFLVLIKTSSVRDAILACMIWISSVRKFLLPEIASTYPVLVALFNTSRDACCSSDGAELHYESSLVSNTQLNPILPSTATPVSERVRISPAHRCVIVSALLEVVDEMGLVLSSNPVRDFVRLARDLLVAKRAYAPVFERIGDAANSANLQYLDRVGKHATFDSVAGDTSDEHKESKLPLDMDKLRDLLASDPLLRDVELVERLDEVFVLNMEGTTPLSKRKRALASKNGVPVVSSGSILATASATTVSLFAAAGNGGSGSVVSVGKEMEKRKVFTSGSLRTSVNDNRTVRLTDLKEALSINASIIESPGEIELVEKKVSVSEFLDTISNAANNDDYMTTRGEKVQEWSKRKITPSELLAWAVVNQQTAAEDRTVNRKLDPIDPKWIDVILGKPEAAQMREAMEAALSETSDMGVRVRALEDLLDLVEQLHNANNMRELRLWEPIFSLAQHHPPAVGAEGDATQRAARAAAIRYHAFWIIGAAVQNNFKAQDDCLRVHDAMGVILGSVVNGDEDTRVRAKALFALAGLLRGNPQGLEVFEAARGWDALVDHVLNVGYAYATDDARAPQGDAACDDMHAEDSGRSNRRIEPTTSDLGEFHADRSDAAVLQKRALHLIRALLEEEPAATVSNVAGALHRRRAGHVCARIAQGAARESGTDTELAEKALQALVALSRTLPEPAVDDAGRRVLREFISAFRTMGVDASVLESLPQ